MNTQTNNGLQVNVILKSRSPGGLLCTTAHLRYPRFIHAEVMTHRVLSRNGRSSRAVPSKTMFEEVRNNPVVPWRWTKNQPGMQGDLGHNSDVVLYDFATNSDHPEDYEGYDIWSREQFNYPNEAAWLWARDKALESAIAFEKAGYHKQVFNRLLEPFMWMDLLVTGVEWNNLFWLRCHKAAEPHLVDLADLMVKEFEAAPVQDLGFGEWHLPYINQDDRDAALYSGDTWFLHKLSAARSARISYAPFDGNPSYEREFERYNLLVKSDRVHASPLEHQAIFLKEGEYDPRKDGNLFGMRQYRKYVPNESISG